MKKFFLLLTITLMTSFPAMATTLYFQNTAINKTMSVKISYYMSNGSQFEDTLGTLAQNAPSLTYNVKSDTDAKVTYSFVYKPETRSRLKCTAEILSTISSTATENRFDTVDSGEFYLKSSVYKVPFRCVTY